MSSELTPLLTPEEAFFRVAIVTLCTSLHAIFSPTQVLSDGVFGAVLSCFALAADTDHFGSIHLCGCLTNGLQ